jgi:hypothetical protein
MSLNKRQRVRGRVYRDRFGSYVIEGEEYRKKTGRYIDLNPVRAGVCDHPRDWRWSSFRALTGLAPKPEVLDDRWLVPLFGNEMATARQAYTRYCEEALPALFLERARELLRPVPGQALTERLGF